MKIKYYLCMLLIAGSLSVAYGEVFKCKLATGKTVYQPEPCPPAAASQRIINVETMTPEQIDTAKAKLRAWQDQQAAEDAAKAEVERVQQLDRERRESLELQRRSVLAQEQQAIAAQRQNQRMPGFIYPGNVPCSRSPWEHYDWEHRHRQVDCFPGQPGYYPSRPPMQTPPQQIQPPDKVERFDAGGWRGGHVSPSFQSK